MTKSIAKKSTTGSLPPAVPLAITPTFSPWTHASDDSYIYQLSLVLATATVSFSRVILCTMMIELSSEQSRGQFYMHTMVHIVLLPLLLLLCFVITVVSLFVT